MKISNYFAKEKMDDASFIQTYIEKLNDLTEEDICWANSDLEEDQEVKTRFYFDGDKLVYIKTIIGDKQELLKVDISDNVDNNLFEIPSDYKEV